MSADTTDDLLTFTAIELSDTCGMCEEKATHFALIQQEGREPRGGCVCDAHLASMTAEVKRIGAELGGDVRDSRDDPTVVVEAPRPRGDAE